jgi:hypothetical protein
MRQRLAIGLVALLVLAVGAAVTATAYPAGADGRGREILAGAVRLSGSQEVPPADPDGRGSFAYFAVDDVFCYVMTAHKIDPPIAAHIHIAPAGVNGPIVVPLELPDPHSADCIVAEPDESLNSPQVLTQGELDAIIANPAGYYTNVHTAPFPGGAIRGQLR